MIIAIRTLLLAGAASAALAVTAQAAPKSAAETAAQQAKLDALAQQVQNLNTQVAQLRQAQASGNADSDSTAALFDLKRSTSDQYVDINNRLDAQPKIGVDNGRFTIASADGRFSFSLRSLIQYDQGYFAQRRNPTAVDLNSGGNFRRAQFGFVGTAWKDWSYNFTYDFGGNGAEKSGYIYSAYVQYDGFKPFGIRIGAYAPPAGLEDSTGSADLLFLERPASSDIARNIAGSPSRNAITLFAQGDNYLLAASYTGNKTAQTGDAATFDEQQAFVGRAAWLAVNESDVHWLLDADFTHVFKLADATANSNATAFTFSNGPELGVDGSKTVGTAAIDAKNVTEWGLETALNWNSLYGQGGYFHYDITRRTGTLPDPSFSGWYALATWALTGESHRYDPTTASFRGLRPINPLGSGGFGAWEVAARYSNIDLNDNPLIGATHGAVTGGEQNVWTLGLNWYPTDGIRFAFNYDNITVNHPNAPGTDISADAFALRTQLSL